MDCAPTFDEAVKDAEAIILLVKHTEFANLNPREVAEKTNARTVVDTVGAWNADEWREAGFEVWRLGVGK